MPRIARSLLVVPGAPHHLIVRGNNRRRLFSYSTCYARYLREMECAAELYAVAIHALVLMTNHAHLVATPPSCEALSAFMHRLGQQYAVFRNRRRRASGKLFEERFWSRAILDERYFARVVPYVELNPERAGLTRDLADHRWSTYWLHAGRPELSAVAPSLWTPSPWWTSLGTTVTERGRRHVELVNACRAAGGTWLEPGHAEDVATRERASTPYGRRLLRPDGSRVAEEAARFRRVFR